MKAATNTTAKAPNTPWQAAAGIRGSRKPVATNPLWRALSFGTGSSAMAASEAVLAPIQRKPTVSTPGDASEREADEVADKVMRMAEPAPIDSASVVIARKCAACEDEGQIQTQRSPSADTDTGLDSAAAVRAAARGGAPLPREARSYFEPRFGHDFSQVRVHADAEATSAARAVQARAYTFGRNIVFGDGEYAPETPAGRRLLAHELTHVVQQGVYRSASLQRCPDAATDAVYDKTAGTVKAHPEYAKLPPAPTQAQPGAKPTADKIIVDAKPKNDCTVWMDKLKLLFDTAVKAPAVIGAETKAATAKAVVVEQKRMAQPQANAKENLEKSAAANAVFGLPRPGKFGGGNYFIDARDPNNIIVKASILLTKKGGGTDKDVDSIKSMKDAIEKHASTVGYIVSIDFVDVADKDTFKVDVDTDKWEVATNWSGGAPKGFAHELHHMLAFPLDRYDYTSHATNQSMEISNRVYWFAQELTKPAGYNNPMSIMNTNDHPNDDDACTVAGLLVADCVASRQKVTTALDSLNKAYKTPDERVMNCISKFQKTDVNTMMAVLREILRQLFGLPEAANLAKRLKSKDDVLGKVFQTLSADQQKELLKIITP